MTMWLSVDPMSDKYPSISPYAYCAWNPVKLIDPDGRTIWIIGDDGNKYSYNQGKIFDETGSEYTGTDHFIEATKTSLDRNRNHDFSKSTIDYFSRQPEEKESVTIKRYDGITITDNILYSSETQSRSATILYNPTMGLADDDGNVLTPASCLQHELGHVANAQYVDPVWGNFTDRKTTTDNIWKNKEEMYNIKIHEHGLATQNNELVRKTYNIGVRLVKVGGPLSKEIKEDMN